jgi:uncharacterized protein YeaO (DUF488 family)
VTERGSVRDTYVAALQHDQFEPAPGETLVGVVRRPTPWFHGAVDENEPRVAPPEPLLDDAKARQAELEADGVAGDDAHDRAWADTDFECRYREHLASDDDAQAAVADLRERLDAGESLVLVCFENTEQKRCHRTILREVLVEEA